MKFLRCIALFAIVLVLFLGPFPAMASDFAGQYNDAIEAVNRGEYQAALDRFNALGGYEQAGKYAMYCKANLMAEGGMYDLAVSSLETLGDFLDSGMLAIYYTARDYEDKGEYLKAADLYKTIAAFRDSLERIQQIKSAPSSGPAKPSEQVAPQVLLEDNYQEDNKEGALIGLVTVNQGQSSHIRSGDSIENKSIAIGRNGDTFDCVGLTLKGWYRILLPGGKIGYISYKYTKLDKSAHKEPKAENLLKIMSTQGSSERPRSAYTDGAGNYYYYYAQNMLDGDLTTSWTPGTGTAYGGNGVGEYADFFFKSSVHLEGIQLLNGYQRNKEAFYQNNRPKRIEVSFQRDGKKGFDSPVEFTLYDNQVGWQHLVFTAQENVSAFRIKVLDVYTGTKFDYDLGITEVRASGRE